MGNIKNRLKGHTFYLSGGIDRFPDRGILWRQEIKIFLHNLEAGVLDPCNKPINFGKENDEDIKLRNELKKEAKDLYSQDYNIEANYKCKSICNLMKSIVAADMRMLDLCHAVILHIDTDYHLCGSYFEMTYACLEHKPIIIHCEQGKMCVPDWCFGIIPHELIFSTWDEVKDYLRHIAYDDNINHLKRWRFFDFNNIYGRDVFCQEAQ